jgi:hypothetical protein
VAVSYDDQFVDLAGGHVTLIAQLDAEISEYYVRNIFNGAKRQ